MQCSLMLAVLALAFGQDPAPSDLPKIELSDFPAAVTEQVREAWDAARAAPRDAGAIGKLGMLLEVYKRREPAAFCYERAHRLDPGAFRWLYYLGSIQSALGNRADATSTLREALRRDPQYLPAQLKLAENLLAAGEWDEGAGLYDSIIKEHPDAGEAYYGMGRVKTARGDLAAAVQLYEKACELFPSYGAAHYGLAMAYRKLGNAAKSEEHLKQHAANKTLVPPVPDPLRDEMRALDRGASSLVQRGRAFEQVGRITEAIGEHEKALELDPEFVVAHSNLIILYGRVNQPQKAEEHFRAAVRLNPNHAESYYNYGVLLTKERRFSEAEEMFRKAVEADPFHSQAMHNLGSMQEQQGRLDEALESYRKAVARQPDYPLAHFNIGRILANQKKYDEAISEFLIALSPDNDYTPACLYALSATYARAGNREEALKYGRQAREKALARGQTQLLRSIEKDLQILENGSLR